MKTYQIFMTTANTKVEADRVTFEPGHVCFWEDPEKHSGRRPRLIRAIHNPAVEEVREVEQ